MRLSRRVALAALAALLVGAVFPRLLLAQEEEARVQVEAAQPGVAQPASAQPTPSNRPGGSPMPAQGSPEAKSGEKPSPDAKTPEKKKEEKDEASSPVTRPKEPPAPADPAELRVRPSEDGMVRFSFRNQPWPAVLQWLADVSGLSLDWQELPGDYLNLTLQRPYKLEEARDLVNRHLLARGYTMLEDGETLTVVKLDKLNPALVPRVSPEELESREPYEFVKVSFPLDWMLAEKAAEELKPMLSAHGKLFPLKETNRLEAIDTAANLREVHRMLTQEQSTAGEDRLVREFPLQHTRAADVRELLMELLGMETKKESSGPMTPQEMQMMQQRAMMQQQMAQRGGGNAPAPGAKKEEDVSLIVNPRNNSVLATAPPDKMAIIDQAVKMLDVPAAREQSLLANMTKLQVYRLSSIEPEPIVKTLEELGDLSPQTRLEIDGKNQAIIAYATLADHVIIRAMVEKLDGSARSFEVLPLRRLSADYVAGTLRFLLGGEEEQQQRRYPYYFYGGRQEENEKDEFRVDADVENNRLLVWANPTELEEVMALLEKLGEIPQRGGDPRRVRTVEILPNQQSPEFFDRLEKAWRSLAPNELEIDPTLERGAGDRSDSAVPTPSASSRPATKELEQADNATASITAPSPNDSPATAYVHLAQLRRNPEQAANRAEPEQAAPAPLPANSPDSQEQSEPQQRDSQQRDSQQLGPQSPSEPPIRISRGPDGRLVVASQDPRALDLLEDLLREMAPPRKEFEVFQLKYAPAYWVALNLEDFFEEEEKDDRGNGFPRWYYWDMPQESDEKDPRRLSNRRPLKFISDDDTNTIVVQGADPQQLQTIEQLIQLYDQPPPEDSQSRRVTQIFAIQYSKADIIADAIKDVYRDLLSANDKALAQQNQQQNQRPATGETYITNIGFGEGEEDQRDRPSQVTFKGKLSIGVDPLTNTLLVSTEGEALMHNIQEMVQRLDQAAQPRTTVEVLHVGGLGGSDLQKALAEIFREQVTSPNGQNQQQNRPATGGNQPQQTNQPNAAATGG